MLEYRLTRGPSAERQVNDHGNTGCGFRGPGETKLETDKRIIKDKIIRVKKEISLSNMQRVQNRKNRYTYVLTCNLLLTDCQIDWFVINVYICM